MGGHGGLNILPQKRWNVYNWDNRERVRKDEEEAARQEQQQQQQAQEREAELRLNRLRDNARARALRAGSNDRDGEDRQVLSAPSPASPQKQHHFLNLFEELEAREQQEAKEKQADGSNVERHFKRQKKAEVSAEDEKYRLGYGSTGKQPWYMSSAPSLDDTKQQQPPHAGGASKRGKVARKSMSELRAERLKREEAERAKARQLVRARRPSSPSSKQQRHYNAGYGNARP